MKQVNKDHYNFEKYSYPERWASYYYQLKETLNLSPESILEVGVGDGVFRSYIKHNASIMHKSLDIAGDVNPDIVGSVDNIPFSDNSFDLVCAFEVLEHLPFEKLEQSLKELKRVSKKQVLISLPHFGPPIKFCIKLPFLREIRLAWKIPYPKKHVFNGEHYWEIGKKGYGPAKLRSILEKYFVVKKDFVPFESNYHHFYVLEKKS